ncbi:MAG: heavy-metal-associated domain-containing protein [Cyanobacteria bacterium J06621_8]
MTINLQVPSMVCEGCVAAVKDAIIAAEPSAKVEIDLATKKVAVESSSSEAAIKQIIIDVGHEVA